MTSDLSIFAARLRDFIHILAEESDFGASPSNREQTQHTDAEFNGLALVLFALQFANNAPYRKFCEARNVLPDTIAHWTQIPAIPTSAFKELELTSLPPQQRTSVFHSSGTTGQIPSRHFHSAESLDLYEASLWPWFERHVLRDFHFPLPTFRFLFLTPPPAKVPHSSLVHMFETVRRKLAAPESSFLGKVDANGAWTLDCDSVVAVLNSSHATHHPSFLLGTAFSFVHLLDLFVEKNLRFQLPEGSHVMETGGYKGRSRSLPKKELHALITERLGIPQSQIICEYGMSELSSQAYHSSHGTHHYQFPPWARVQIISPETGREVADGETGLIRVFDLANVFSAMAVQTEDLAVRRNDGFELIGRAENVEARGCSLMVA